MEETSLWTPVAMGGAGDGDAIFACPLEAQSSGWGKRWAVGQSHRCISKRTGLRFREGYWSTLCEAFPSQCPDVQRMMRTEALRWFVFELASILCVSDVTHRPLAASPPSCVSGCVGVYVHVQKVRWGPRGWCCTLKHHHVQVLAVTTQRDFTLF